MEILLLEMPAWQVFAAIGICLSVGEIFIPGFIALPIGLGFILVAPIAYFSNSIVLQLIALALIEVVVFLLLRKFRPEMSKPTVYSNTEGMLGKECEVIEAVSAKQSGYVKLYGDRWQAKTYSMRTFKQGDRVVISRIDGNKVFIEELNSREDS